MQVTSPCGTATYREMTPRVPRCNSRHSWCKSLSLVSLVASKISLIVDGNSTVKNIEDLLNKLAPFGDIKTETYIFPRGDLVHLMPRCSRAPSVEGLRVPLDALSGNLCTMCLKRTSLFLASPDLILSRSRLVKVSDIMNVLSETQKLIKDIDTFQPKSTYDAFLYIKSALEAPLPGQLRDSYLSEVEVSISSEGHGVYLGACSNVSELYRLLGFTELFNQRKLNSLEPFALKARSAKNDDLYVKLQSLGFPSSKSLPAERCLVSLRPLERPYTQALFMMYQVSKGLAFLPKALLEGMTRIRDTAAFDESDMPLIEEIEVFHSDGMSLEAAYETARLLANTP